jgi:hypothetical protein
VQTRSAEVSIQQTRSGAHLELVDLLLKSTRLLLSRVAPRLVSTSHSSSALERASLVKC